MKNYKSGITAILAVCLLGNVFYQNCTPISAREAAQHTATYQTCRCGGIPITIGPVLPSGNGMSNQSIANCMGWQQFIAVNWPVDTQGPFGQPGDLSPVRWELYKPTDQIFKTGAAKPHAWYGHDKLPAGVNERKYNTGKYILLEQHEKAPNPFVSRSFGASNFSPDQVVLNNGPAWLGAQDSTNIWYEVLVNKVEYDYIVNNSFYNAQAQLDSSAKGKQIFLPDTGDGSIEIKAAWMEVKDTSNPRWKQRYKLSPAYVQDAANGKYREAVVALIGLHVLRKVPSQPTFVTTFEQVDNVPDSVWGYGPPYNLFNPAASPITMTVKTRANTDTVVTIGTTPNVQPPYYLVNGNKPMPVNVNRAASCFGSTHVPANDSANAQAIRGIVAAYPNSVWQYYRLINVIWSSSPTYDNSQPQTDSLLITGMQPVGPVSNSTLETYNQLTSCAQTCHKKATIAHVPGNKIRYLTDFSFVFSLAKMPASAGLHSQRK